MENIDLENKNYLITDQQMVSITTSPSETLAAHVVAYRTIGINKEIAIECMKELSKRRKSGEEFNFENYIEEQVAKIPKSKGIDYVKIIKNMIINK